MNRTARLKPTPATTAARMFISITTMIWQYNKTCWGDLAICTTDIIRHTYDNHPSVRQHYAIVVSVVPWETQQYIHDNWRWTLHWRHDDNDGVSNHQPHGCLLNRLFGRRSKKISKLCVTDLCAGNSPGPVNSPHKGPVTRFHLMTSSWTNDVWLRMLHGFRPVISSVSGHHMSQCLIFINWALGNRRQFTNVFWKMATISVRSSCNKCIKQNCNKRSPSRIPSNWTKFSSGYGVVRLTSRRQAKTCGTFRFTERFLVLVG